MKSFKMLTVSVFVCFSLLACGKKTGLEGKIVDIAGNPVTNVYVVVTQLQPIKGFERLHATTGSDGAFHVVGVFPNSDYMLSLWSESWANTPLMAAGYEPTKLTAFFNKEGWTTDNKLVITTAPEGETRLLASAILVRPVKIEEYFPLKEGLRWTYESSNSNGTVLRKQESKTLAPVELKEVEAGHLAYGKKVTPIKSEFSPKPQSQRNSILYYCEEQQGLFLVAIQRYDLVKEAYTQVSVHNPASFVIKYPLQSGTILSETNKDSAFHIEIESTSDVVTVPAGTFQGCLRIKHRFYRLNTETLAWYAPNIGFVKSISTDNTGEAVITVLTKGPYSGFTEDNGKLLTQTGQTARSGNQIATKAQIAVIETALDAFNLDMGRYPTQEEGLEALRKNPGSPKWEGPYLAKDVPKDSWGRPFVYRCPGKGRGHELFSFGADGKEGGEGENADVTTWR